MIRRWIAPTLLVVFMILTVFSFGSAATYPSPPPQSRPPQPGPPPPSSRPYTDMGVFYERLAPHGDWFWLQGYGWVWTPNEIWVGWRPFAHGRWIYTDYGLTWLSDWEWGWATHHYGHWLYEPRFGHGWVWVPGTRWAPSNAVIRFGAGWVGWAPLPPRYELWSSSYARAPIPLFSWCFVEERYLIDADVSDLVTSRIQNGPLMRLTANVTNYAMANNQVTNQSFSYAQLQGIVGQPVTQYRIVSRDSVPEFRGRVRGEEVYMFRKELREAPSGITPRSYTPKPPPGSGPKAQRPVYSREELQRHQEEEVRRLNAKHQAERANLEEEQRKELQRPPKGVSPEELRRQQQAERRELDEQERLEIQLLRERQEKERKGEIEPRSRSKKEKDN